MAVWNQDVFDPRPGAVVTRSLTVVVGSMVVKSIVVRGGSRRTAVVRGVLARFHSVIVSA